MSDGTRLPPEEHLQLFDRIFLITGKFGTDFNVTEAKKFLANERHLSQIDTFLVAYIGATSKKIIPIDDVIDAVMRFNDDAYIFNDKERSILNALSKHVPPSIIFGFYTKKPLDLFTE